MQTLGDSYNKGDTIAKNLPSGDGHQHGTVEDRSQIHNSHTDKWVKRDSETDRFIDRKSDQNPF